MKKLAPMFALLFFVMPTISFAAALTTQQSTSLIAVVQSSPGTPASAFVNLITAFSNITVNQATSLISVVQASPGTAAGAFVDLLTSFTDDTSITQNAVQDSALKTQVDTLTQQVEALQQSQTQQNTETQQKLGQIVQNTTHAPIPVPRPVVKELEIVPSGGNLGSTFVIQKSDAITNRTYASPIGLASTFFVIYTENGNDVANAPITLSTPDGSFWVDGVGRVNSTATFSARRIDTTMTTRRIGIEVTYFLHTVGIRTITIKAGGITRTIEVGRGLNAWPGCPLPIPSDIPEACTTTNIIE